jgi:Ni,Fe-hydrogenase I large subunit
MNTGTCTNDAAFYALPGAASKLCVNFLYKLGETESNDITKISENMAKSFYKQMSDYDYTTNKHKTDKTYDNVNQFTAMIWKGTADVANAADEFAAFAIQSGCAAARFCAKTNKPNDP